MNQESENTVDKIVEKELEPTMGLDYLVEVTDKDGKVLQSFSGPSRSFVRQWYDLMSGMADNLNRLTKDTAGVNRSAAPDEDCFLARSTVAGVTSYGPRVGKGTTPVTISDYALETPLEEGTGLDQFEHLAPTYGKPAVVGSTCSFWLRRSMLNSSGATITGIKEIGVYIRGGSYYFLGVRDVLPSAVYVPDGGAITVTYTFKVTV